MNEAKLIHRLLYFALIDIRANSAAKDQRDLGALADLFHVAALQLGQAAEGKEQYSKILSDLKQRAEHNGCSSWLSNALRESMRFNDS